MAKASNMDHTVTSRIYSRDLFESEFSLVLDPSADKVEHPEAALSSTDFNILLRYLSRDKPYLSFDSNTVKLKAPAEAQPSAITQHDIDIANLRTLISALDAQVNALTARITSLDMTARAAVAAKRTHTAKSALRSKKLAETTLHTRSETLSQLEATYTSIETAADQVAIVRAMEASGSVLKALHAEVGGVEGVEAVIDRLRDEMENVDEVGRVINQTNTGAQIDEMEVDDEFEALEKAEQEKKEREEAERTADRLRELKKVEETVQPREVEESIREKEAESQQGEPQGEVQMENA